MRRNARAPKRINQTTQHDLKLELDVRCQTLIERQLLTAFPGSAFLGEEGTAGPQQAARRWVVDPIDGTVNFAYGIPHACVSIALQERAGASGYVTVAGAVFDPFCDELWTAIRGKPARLNGRAIRVSDRRRLDEAIVALGAGKQLAALAHMTAVLSGLVRRTRKLRLMGSAALALTYVASGRMDAYVERGLSWWDIAAGGLILECAGGEFWHRELPEGGFDVLASNGHLRGRLRATLPSERELANLAEPGGGRRR